MSTPIPTIVPKLLALAGSDNQHEATNALRMARAQLKGDWSPVTKVTRWMIDDRRFVRLLDTAATAEGDVGAKALRDAQRMMAKIQGLDFQFLSRKVADLHKAPGAAKIRTSKREPKRASAKAERSAPRVTEATWAECFAVCAAANPERATAVRSRTPRRAVRCEHEQLSFEFGAVQ